ALPRRARRGAAAVGGRGARPGPPVPAGLRRVHARRGGHVHHRRTVIRLPFPLPEAPDFTRRSSKGLVPDRLLRDIFLKIRRQLMLFHRSRGNPRLAALAAATVLGVASVASAAKCPNVMFVVDRSGSMG